MQCIKRRTPPPDESCICFQSGLSGANNAHNDIKRWLLVSQRQATTFSNANAAQPSVQKPRIRSLRQIGSIEFMPSAYSGIPIYDGREPQGEFFCAPAVHGRYRFPSFHQNLFDVQCGNSALLIIRFFKLNADASSPAAHISQRISAHRPTS